MAMQEGFPQLQHLKEQNKKEQEVLCDNLFSEISNELSLVEINEKSTNSNGDLLAPNGRKSELPTELHWKIVRTPTFLKWFGDWQNDPESASKVVNKKTGEPLLVYHATDVEDIIGAKLVPSDKENKKPHNIGTIYFTSQKQNSHYFLENKQDNENFLTSNGNDFQGENIKYFSCFLNIKKPLLCRDMNDIQNIFVKEKLPILGGARNKYDKFLEQFNSKEDILNLKYDGIIQTSGYLSLESSEFSISGDQFICFDLNQVLISPSDVNLQNNIYMEHDIDVLRYSNQDFKEFCNTIVYLTIEKNLRKEALLNKKKKILRLLKKINVLIKDGDYINYNNEVKKNKSRFEQYLNIIEACIAFNAKDVEMLKTCLDNALWKKEEIYELLEILKKNYELQ